MSQGETVESHSQRSSSPGSTEYAAFTPRSPSTAAYNGSSERSHNHGNHSSPTSSPVSAMEFHDSRGLTPLQRWAANASDTQFHALGGAVGGFTSGIVTCPLDVIKTKLQAQGGFLPVSKGRHVGHQKVYSGLVGTGGIIWREEGIRGLYRGLGPIVLGYLPTWAVWFTVYNKSKKYMADHHSKSGPNSVSRVQLLNLPGDSAQRVYYQLLVINHSWREQHHSNESDMGHQNTAHVTISEGL